MTSGIIVCIIAFSNTSRGTADDVLEREIVGMTWDVTHWRLDVSIHVSIFSSPLVISNYFYSSILI